MSQEDINRKLWNTFAELIQDMNGSGSNPVTYDGSNNHAITMILGTPMSAPWNSDNENSFLNDDTNNYFNMIEDIHGSMNNFVQHLSSQLNLNSTLKENYVKSDIPDLDDLQFLMDQNNPDTVEKRKAYIDENESKPIETSYNDGQYPPVDDNGDPKPPQDPAFNSKSGKTINELNLSNQLIDFNKKVAFLPAQYGPIWIPGSVRVADAYRGILMEIDIGIREEQRDKIGRIFKEYLDAANDYGSTQILAVKNYVEYKQAMEAANVTPDSLAVWLNDSGWTQKLQAAKTYNDSKYAVFLQGVQDAGLRQDLIDAVTAIKKKNAQLFTMGLDPTERIREWNEGRDDKFEMTKNTWDTTFDYSQTSWKVSTSGHLNYVTFRGGASGGHEHTSISHDNISINFKCKGLENIPIIAGDVVGDKWSQNSVISKYCGHLINNNENNWTPNSVFYGKYPQRNPYGPNGFLPYWPTGVVICYQPSFNLSMKKTDFEKDESYWKAGGGICVGPFSFGGANASHDEIRFEDKGDTMNVVLEDKSKIPKILCFQMQIMPPNFQI